VTTRRLLLVPLWFIVSLATFLGLGTSSAAASSGPETRVRANSTVVEKGVAAYGFDAPVHDVLSDGVLRQEMSRGMPIRDASVDPATGQLVSNTGFLRAEPGQRDQMRQMSVITALDMLRRLLIDAA
jgi:hypothetical protein